MDNEEPVALDGAHWHEALDRTNMIAEIFEAHVLYHPTIRQQPDLLAIAEEVSSFLGKLYQAIGSHTNNQSF